MNVGTLPLPCVGELRGWLEVAERADERLGKVGEKR
jgi:hypothetical protein